MRGVFLSLVETGGGFGCRKQVSNVLLRSVPKASIFRNANQDRALMTTSRQIAGSSSLSHDRRKHTVDHKGTYVFQHVYAPERTPDSQPQRNPREKEKLQYYELIDNGEEKSVGPVKIILLEDVEGVGLQFDVVDVERNVVRNNLIPLRRAVYASPFDLEYYAKKKEELKDELRRRIRVPYDYIKIGRSLMARVVPILVSMDNPWTLDKEITLLSLLEMGISTSADNIYLPKKEICGPQLELESCLLRFYIVVNRSYVVPMLGRLTHISADANKQNLYPENASLPTRKQLEKLGLKLEDPYYFQQPLADNFDVVDFMETLSGKQQ